MKRLQKYARQLGLAPESDAFNRARFEMLVHHLPLLYIGIIASTIAIASTFIGTAPHLLTLGVPVILFVVAIRRFFYWRAVDPTMVDDREIARKIREVTTVAMALCTAYTIWMLILSTYGDPTQLVFLSLFVFIWTVSAAYSMAAIPFLCLFLVLTVSALITGRFIYEGSMNFIIASVQLAFSCGIIFMIVRQSYNHLAVVVSTQEELEEKRLQAETSGRHIAEIAFQDFLTGLANRRKFEAELTRLIADREYTDRPFGLGILDLDGFKPINDLYGHRAGDIVLQQASQRLSRTLGDAGMLARLGGDEFGIILTEDATPETAEALGNALCDSLRASYDIGPNQAHLTGSCGFAIFPANGRNPDILMSRADNALYDSKRRARGNTTIFSPRLENAIQRRSLIEQALRKAIADDDIEMFFQPIFTLSNMEISSFEALARWRDDQLGTISPAEFIPVAEQSGLIEELSESLLRQAAEIAVTWPGDVMLSFNLSAVQLGRKSTGLRILNTLAKAGLPPHRLEVEVTETAIVTDDDLALSTLQDLHAAGVRIALDDFGTGHSSLGKLQNIPFDRLKIDKSFITSMLGDDKTKSIVRAIVEMSAGIGVETVAEGIENQRQIAALRRLGCRYGQGYLLSEPMSAKAASDLLRIHFADLPLFAEPTPAERKAS